MIVASLPPEAASTSVLGSGESEGGDDAIVGGGLGTSAADAIPVVGLGDTFVDDDVSLVCAALTTWPFTIWKPVLSRQHSSENFVPPQQRLPSLQMVTTTSVEFIGTPLASGTRKVSAQGIPNSHS